MTVQLPLVQNLRMWIAITPLYHIPSWNTFTLYLPNSSQGMWTCRVKCHSTLHHYTVCRVRNYSQPELYLLLNIFNLQLIFNVMVKHVYQIKNTLEIRVIQLNLKTHLPLFFGNFLHWTNNTNAWKSSTMCIRNHKAAYNKTQTKQFYD